MSYLVPADLLGLVNITELAQLTFPDGSPPNGLLLAATINDADTSDWEDVEIEAAAAAVIRLQAGIDTASSIIDSYLAAAQYALPPINTPASLKREAAALVMYDLYGNAPIPDAVEQRKRDALDWLARVADGKIRLDLGQAGDAALGSPSFATPARQFAADTLADF